MLDLTADHASLISIVTGVQRQISRPVPVGSAGAKAGSVPRNLPSLALLSLHQPSRCRNNVSPVIQMRNQRWMTYPGHVARRDRAMIYVYFFFIQSLLNCSLHDCMQF